MSVEQPSRILASQWARRSFSSSAFPSSPADRPTPLCWRCSRGGSRTEAGGVRKCVRYVTRTRWRAAELCAIRRRVEPVPGRRRCLGGPAPEREPRRVLRPRPIDEPVIGAQGVQQERGNMPIHKTKIKMRGRQREPSSPDEAGSRDKIEDQISRPQPRSKLPSQNTSKHSAQAPTDLRVWQFVPLLQRRG